MERTARGRETWARGAAGRRRVSEHWGGANDARYHPPHHASVSPVKLARLIPAATFERHSGGSVFGGRNLWEEQTTHGTVNGETFCFVHIFCLLSFAFHPPSELVRSHGAVCIAHHIPSYQTLVAYTHGLHAAAGSLHRTRSYRPNIRSCSSQYVSQRVESPAGKVDRVTGPPLCNFTSVVYFAPRPILSMTCDVRSWDAHRGRTPYTVLAQCTVLSRFIRISAS